MTTTTPLKNIGKLMSTAQAAKYTGLSISYLTKLRAGGKWGFTGGPNYIKSGNRVKYFREDLDQWLENDGPSKVLPNPPGTPPKHRFKRESTQPKIQSAPILLTEEVANELFADEFAFNKAVEKWAKKVAPVLGKMPPSTSKKQTSSQTRKIVITIEY